MRFSEKCLVVCYEIETLLHILPQASYLNFLMGYPQISVKDQMEGTPIRIKSLPRYLILNVVNLMETQSVHAKFQKNIIGNMATHQRYIAEANVNSPF